MRLAYGQLPPPVQKAISNIIRHRAELDTNARHIAIAGIPSIAFAWYAFRDFKTAQILLPTSIILSSMVALQRHQAGFRKEYLQLFRKLKEHATNTELAPLLSSPHTRFLCIHADGSLSAKEKMPGNLVAYHFGRRPTANPLITKQRVSEWKRRLSPSSRRRTRRR